LGLPSWIPTAFLFLICSGHAAFPHGRFELLTSAGIKSAENQLLAARIVSEFCPDKDN